MKKKNRRIAAMTAAVLFLLLLSGCDPEEDPGAGTGEASSESTEAAVVTEHVHQFGEWQETDAPTCTESGRRARRCACGEEETEEIPAAGHSAGEWSVLLEAACTETGIRVRSCAVCGTELEREPIAAAGHTTGEWITDTEPTCTAAGSRRRVCSVCGETIDAEELPAVGHKPGGWETVTRVTCTEPGKDIRRCTVCGEIVAEQEFRAMGHLLREWVLEREPTCAQTGLEQWVCRTCGEVLETHELDRVPHQESDWIVDHVASCTTGLKRHTECIYCGMVVRQENSPAAHSGTGLICDLCGGYRVPINQVGKNDRDGNGLLVTLLSFTSRNYAGYTEYSISYRVSNDTPNSKIMPGGFKLFFEDGSVEDQNLVSNYLYYGESVVRYYTWKAMKTQKVLALEYYPYDLDTAGLNSQFFKKILSPDAMHWLPEEIR